MVLSPCVALERQRIQVRSKDPPSPENAAKTEIPALESLDGKKSGVGAREGKPLHGEELTFQKRKGFCCPELKIG